MILFFWMAMAGAVELRGTNWSGTYTAVGYTGKISVNFRDDLSAKGEIGYDFKPDFSVFPTPIAQFLNYADSPCAHTPRGVRLRADGTGTISVYKCAADADEEKRLAADPERPVASSHQVTKLVQSEDGKFLVIKAKLFGMIPVKYRLSR